VLPDVLEHQFHEQSWLVVLVLEDLHEVVQLGAVVELVLKFAFQSIEFQQRSLPVVTRFAKSYQLIQTRSIQML
jgi:hypothetical protein